MGLETGVTYIEDLVTTNPVGATDNVDEGDNHIRNIKTAVQGSFPNLGSAAVTKLATEINDLLEKSGGTMTGNLTIDKGSPTFTLNSDSSHGFFYIYDTVAAKNRTLFFWDRTNDQTRLRQYDTDGTTTRAEIILDELGTVDIGTGSFKIGGTGSITAIHDEDTMSSDDVNGLATQKSIKAYVDTETVIGPGDIGQTEIAPDAVRFLSEIDNTTTTSTISSITSTTPQVIPAGVVNLGQVTAGSSCKLQGYDGTAWVDLTALISSGSNIAEQTVSDGVNVRLLGGTGTPTTVRYMRIFA